MSTPTLGETAAPAAKAGESVADRLIAVASEIINETGDFDLPMRLLATRAKVSLRTPYTIFGSKSGVITAILHRDQAQWRASLKGLSSGDPIEDLFANLARGIAFFRRRQPFYRALFRATEGYSGGSETEAARENARVFKVVCANMRRAGQLLADTDPDALAESLTDIFAGAHREWAAGGFDIELCHQRTGFGYATLLAGCTPEPLSTHMRATALAYQSGIARFRRERPGANASA